MTEEDVSVNSEEEEEEDDQEESYMSDDLNPPGLEESENLGISAATASIAVSG